MFTKQNLFTGAALAGAMLMAQGALASGAVGPEDEMRSLLREFNDDPAEFMNRPLRKIDGNGRVLPLTDSLFTEEQIRTREFVELKNRSRADLAPGEMLQPFSRVSEGESAGTLVDRFSVRTLEQIEGARLRTAELGQAPWSGDYWPIYQGSIAQRFADPGFPHSILWKENAEYVRKVPNVSSVEALSPAEKYDLLVGDSNRSLTRAMWEEGQEYQQRFGQVESWMGICHGWAPASYMVSRPTKMVRVMAADGRTWIPFYPDDIKALSSLLWANTRFPSKTIGTRCNSKSPRTDSNGRIVEPGCFDNNPAAWHLSVVNQIGVSRRSFVLDAAYDHQVWNQPVLGYSYAYFNPSTNEPARDLRSAMVPVAAFSGDKFRAYRSRGTAYIVGIDMNLTYMMESSAAPVPTDSPAADRRATVRYLYDLELDQAGNILGGEWYTNLHPDFLWTPAREARALSEGDVLLRSHGRMEGWDGRAPVPGSWRQVAPQASSIGQPLAAIVDALTALSSSGAGFRPR